MRSRREIGIVAFIHRLGWPWIEATYKLGTALRFALSVVARSGLCLRRFSLVIREIQNVGVLSLVVILVSGLFIGFVLGLQFYVILDRYGQEQLIGTAVALTLFRELGPVGTALLFVGCACTSMTAAIGLKRASEQIAAMEVMAVDPVAREIAPKFWATMISLPLLTIYFNAIGIFGAYLIAVQQIGVDPGIFWTEMHSKVAFFGDFTGGMIKSVCFAAAVGMISLYQGYVCTPTAEGVSRATTRTVVLGSVTVLGLDFILTAFMIE